MILSRIIEGEGADWCPIELVSGLMNIIRNVNVFLHREFVQRYAKGLIPAVERSILQCPASNLRNFSKEGIDIIKGGLSGLMRRVYSIGEKNEMLEKLNIKLALNAFNSEFIKTQLLGLKILMELLVSLRNEKNMDSLKSAELSTLVEENEIF